MLILSNSLTQDADEGSLKLTAGIVKRIKKENPDTCIVTFEREHPLSDIHLKLNKLHISFKLISILKKQKQPVLYIPFPAPPFSSALRISLISLFARHGLKVMIIQQSSMSRTAEVLLRRSKAELVVFSKKSYDFYRNIVGNRVIYIKTGVDTDKFTPVPPERTAELKIKYGFAPDRKIILHVGHMQNGRNIAELMKIDKKYQILLVTSTLYKNNQNEELKSQLSNCSNIKIIDSYIPNIEEIYQMCDIYFFPVIQPGHCIDVPLSCLEAAACNKPVITTDFGEMQCFKGKEGFFFINEFTKEEYGNLIEQALTHRDNNTRRAVIEYDFNNSVNNLYK